MGSIDNIKPLPTVLSSASINLGNIVLAIESGTASEKAIYCAMRPTFSAKLYLMSVNELTLKQKTDSNQILTKAGMLQFFFAFSQNFENFKLKNV